MDSGSTGRGREGATLNCVIVALLCAYTAELGVHRHTHTHTRICIVAFCYQRNVSGVDGAGVEVTGGGAGYEQIVDSAPCKLFNAIFSFSKNIRRMNNRFMDATVRRG